MKKLILHLIAVLCFSPGNTNAQEIYYKTGSTEKIEQLVGDYDRHLKEATNNLTETRYNFWNTDLGVSFKHNDTTFVVFGAIPGDHGYGLARDPIAFTLDTIPEDGIDLTFITESPGQYKPITIPGIDQGVSNVPLDGISLNNTMYLYHSTDTMKRSALGKSTDGGKTFQLVEDTISINYFINISAEVVVRDSFPGLPGISEKGVLMFGSGEYRKSAIYLAYQPADSIEDKQSIYYYTGMNGNTPEWSRNELESQPILPLLYVGELSAAFNVHLQKWLVLYNYKNPRGVQFRAADMPWGPYSDPVIVFQPRDDNGYCEFMHNSWDQMVCDTVQDLGKENVWGGEYGPYMFNDLSTREDTLVTIYYTLSTTNPYTTILMKSVLVDTSLSVSIPEPPVRDKVYHLVGSTKKIEQIVGDYDKHLKVPTNTLTFANYNFETTDLGVPFNHNDTTFIVFGDIPGDHGFGRARDPIAFTLDTTPEDGIDLTFITESPGQYKPVTIPGLDQTDFNVPLDGISLNNIMYLYHSTDVMTRSALGKSYDSGKTFELVEDTISINHFINISAEIVVRDSFPGLPGISDKGILLFGTGEYRKSDIYLAYQPTDSIEDKRSIYYYTGMFNNSPQWSRDEASAQPIIPVEYGGELSVVFNIHLNKWLVLYNHKDPRGVHFHVADVPWGPYSDPEIVFQPRRDDGYCFFMHNSWDQNVCDSVHDPGRSNQWGGEYGPYMFNDLSTRKDTMVTIYYTLSTWNPYTVELMKSVLIDPTLEVTTYALTVNNGSGSGDYSESAVIEVVADAPPADQTFNQWTGDISALDNPVNPVAMVTMPNSDISITAEYIDIPKYPLSVTKGTGSGDYFEDAEVTIAADDSTGLGKLFIGWSGDLEYLANAADSMTTVTMPTAGVSVTALYDDAASVTKNNLTVNRGTGSGLYVDGAYVSISADAAHVDSVFSAWTGTDVATYVNDVNAASTLLLMPASDYEVTASYMLKPRYTLTVTSGTIVGAGGDSIAEYVEGGSVDIIANSPPFGMTFAAWTGDVSGITDVNSASTSITMPSADVNITATYSALPSYSFTQNYSTFTIDLTSLPGQYITIAAPTILRKYFDHLEGDFATVGAVSTVDNFSFTMPAQDLEFTGIYLDSLAAITVNIIDENGDPFEGAQISFDDYPDSTKTTDAGGLITVYLPREASISTDVDFIVSATGYESRSLTLAVNSWDYSSIDIPMSAVPDGIDESLNFKLSIYPNPARNTINISNGLNINKVYIRDIVGKVLITEEPLNNTTITLNINDLPCGVYLIQAESNGKVYTSRFIKN